MPHTFTTAQEAFWASTFGDDYIDRNIGDDLVASNTRFFSRILSKTRNVNSVMEFGANIGLNLLAIRRLLPKAKLSAIEINQKAYEILKSSGILDPADIHHGSIIDFAPSPICQKRQQNLQSPNTGWDFVLIKTVLIHINPDELGKVYKNLYETSEKYICICEYYNPVPVSITYRGHEDRLFKRDFAGEIMDLYPDLKLVDYGFIWKRDNMFPADDITWFLLEK